MMARARDRAFGSVRAVVFAVVFAAAGLLVAPAGAVNPSERLEDPALEGRARSISAELRCLVCQNQSIDDSDSELARDLRLVVRERLLAGDSDEEVFAYLTARYGAFIRLRPPFTAATLVLWLAPAAAVAGALVAALVYLRGRRRLGEGTGMLSSEEEAALDRLLAERAADPAPPGVPQDRSSRR